MPSEQIPRCLKFEHLSKQLECHSSIETTIARFWFSYEFPRTHYNDFLSFVIHVLLLFSFQILSTRNQRHHDHNSGQNDCEKQLKDLHPNLAQNCASSWMCDDPKKDVKHRKETLKW